MNNPFRRKEKKNTKHVQKELLSVALNLNGNRLSFRPDLQPGGIWKAETDSTRKDEERITTLQAELQQMHKDMKALEEEKLQALEEKYLLEFKSQLLLEMVSVAQLDAKKNLENLEREKLKTEALKWELANLNMEHSQGVADDM